MLAGRLLGNVGWGVAREAKGSVRGGIATAAAKSLIVMGIMGG